MGLKVLVVDDHRMFAEALASRLATVDDINVVGIALDAERALLLARSLRPDVVTLDANLGETDGIDIARALRRANATTKIVMVTCVDDLDRVLQAIWAGVAAWVPKEAATETLIDVVRHAVRGDGWLPPDVLGCVLRAVVDASSGYPPDATRLGVLTPREREVLRCLVAGLDRAGTAQTLGLSLNTVRTHVQSILSKLGVHSTLEAVALALDKGVRPASAAEQQRPHSLSLLPAHSQSDREGRAGR